MAQPAPTILELQSDCGSVWFDYPIFTGENHISSLRITSQKHMMEAISGLGLEYRRAAHMYTLEYVNSLLGCPMARARGCVDVIACHGRVALSSVSYLRFSHVTSSPPPSPNSHSTTHSSTSSLPSSTSSLPSSTSILHFVPSILHFFPSILHSNLFPIRVLPPPTTSPRPAN